MVDFTEMKTTQEEFALINDIANRALAMGLKYDKLSLEMDIEVVHDRYRLRLHDLLNADNFNFMHDITGIVNCLNRETGELENCFIPRYVRRKE